MRTSRHALVWVLAGCALALQCTRPAPKQYPIDGQILAVALERKELTIKHNDIAGLMPAMTMSFPVSDPKLLEGRTPGELVTGTLEVDDAFGKIIALTHVGSAPMPEVESTMAALLLSVGDPVPDAALIDQANQRRSLSEWHGSFAIVTFIYTQCPLPNFCPLMDQNFRTLQGELADDPVLRGRVKLITITFDPAHDTPAVLAEHARKLKADPAVWTMLTGDQVTIDRVAARFGISAFRPTDGPAQITHNLRTAIISPDGKLLQVYSGNEWTPGTILSDLRAAARHP
jgi:protein SCO1/2